MKYIRYLLGVLVLAGFYQFALAQPAIPSGRAITIPEIFAIANTFTNYLYTLAVVIVGIALVWSGIVYTTAGGDSAKVNKAKGILIGAIIGAFVIFASGAIISTIANFTSNPGGFFGGGSAGPLGGTCGTFIPGECYGGSNAGNTCTTNADC